MGKGRGRLLHALLRVLSTLTDGGPSMQSGA